MTRLLMQSLVLAALPFILYGLYVWLTRRGQFLERAPWFPLTVAGLLMMLLGLGVFAYEQIGPADPDRLDAEGRVKAPPAVSGPPPPRRPNDPA